jgi:DNA-binding Lrp family transcriptional regulator
MAVLDEVDHGLIHALQLDGRAAFTTIADVLGTSVQTVIRRYGRLRAAAGLRVVGLADPASARRQQWIVRLTAAASTAQDIGQALARRPDTSWVRLTSGGTEIVAVIHITPGQTGTHALLLHDVPRTSSITAVSAHYLLHTYLGGPTAWRGRMKGLTQAQQDQLPPSAPSRDALGDDRSAAALSDSDHKLIAALSRDGRASYTDLATATGWSASTVARRIGELRSRDALFFDVELDDAALGITAKALLWMSVAPAHLDHVATTLAAHDDLAFVAATTGPTNLLAQALCPDPEALHHFLTRRLGQLTAITAIETAPILRTLKAVAPA